MNKTLLGKTDNQRLKNVIQNSVHKVRVSAQLPLLNSCTVSLTSSLQPK